MGSPSGPFPRRSGPRPERFHVEVDDGRDVEGQELREQQAADHGPPLAEKFLELALQELFGSIAGKLVVELAIPGEQEAGGNRPHPILGGR